MADCSEPSGLSRRGLIGGAASLSLWACLPRAARAAGGREPRLLTIVLRGGLDGMALAAPVGDPDLARLRGRFAVPATGEGAGLPLDGFFVLNSAMPHLHGLYRRGEALIVHAVATPYRERSHFDAQDVLESGLPGVGRVETGWLNRALEGLATDGRADPRGLSQGAQKGLALGAVVPLVMRGPAPVLSWIPQIYGTPLRESTIARLMDLYAQTDPGLAKAFSEGIALDKVALADAGVISGKAPRSQASLASGQASGLTTGQGQPQPAAMREFVETAQAAARFLGSADGPRVGVLSYNGWDTHANEGAVRGVLANRLAGLDQAIRAFAEGVGPAWKDTVVVIVTEFGRTARINGTEGTDHGTATVALLIGGGVKGGRVLADWPGLAEKALHQGRDLRPTLDLRSVLKGVLHDHLGLTGIALDDRVFPGSAAVPASRGLLS
jgi:uncharacterized protein (DUF1501 family)